MQQHNNNAFVDTTASDRSRIMNERAYSRVVPSQKLQPYLSVAPVQTKYTVLPIVNHRKPVTEKLNQLPAYNIKDTFNPGTGVGPWSGFATEVNTESILRNQIYALQKCSQSVYVPKSTSDLYRVNFASTPAQQPFADLFTPYVPTANPCHAGITKGNNLFYNSTRTKEDN